MIDGRYHGIAVGNFVEGGAGGGFENARMTIENDGTVTVAVGSTALGQGLQTILSQIAADALSMPIEQIQLLHGSTTLVTQGFGSFHSRSTVMGGSAILLAAEALIAMLRDKGARHFRCEYERRLGIRWLCSVREEIHRVFYLRRIGGRTAVRKPQADLQLWEPCGSHRGRPRHRTR